MTTTIKRGTYWLRKPGGRRNSWYDKWMEDSGVPIYEGNHVDDLREVELGWWPERECNAAFMQLDGQKTLVDIRIEEIPPGATLPPSKMLIDEKIYVLNGHGLTTIWGGDGPKKSFEWQPHSLFFIPPNYTYQLSNTRGDQPARVIHSSRLDVAAQVISDPDVMFNTDKVDMSILYGDEDIFSEARVIGGAEVGETRRQFVWAGNFFPDVTAWEKLEPHKGRGAGGNTVVFGSRFGGIGSTKASMSVFPGLRYKKAHHHGPGYIIVIPKGDGFTVMWDPAKPEEKLYCPWQEGSLVVPPGHWFHQHFNLGETWARYLKISGHIPATNLAAPSGTIEYPDEDGWIREKFAEELKLRGLVSDMPAECYQNYDYQWPYGEDMSGD